MENKNVQIVKLSQSEKNKALKLIDDILHSMSFFRQNISDWNLTEDEIKTCMGLFESYFTELSPIVGYDSMLTKERSNRYAKIKKLNTQVSHLQSLMGKSITPEAVTGFLKNCDDIFRAWYGSFGFHYASLVEFNYRGAIYDFSDEIDYEAGDGLSSMKDFADKIKNSCTIIADQDKWDIIRDKYHGSMMDTDKNKENMSSLLYSHFPNAEILEYRSRKNDYGSFSVRIKVLIPYTDIWKLFEKYED